MSDSKEVKTDATGTSVHGFVIEPDEIEELRRLVAMYQNEGQSEVDEEEEYRELCEIPKDKRTHAEAGRLRDLAILIPKICCSDELREMVRKAWHRPSGGHCPFCEVQLATDYHLKTCPLGVVLGESR